MSTDRTSSTGFDWLTKRNSGKESGPTSPSSTPQKDNAGSGKKDSSKKGQRTSQIDSTKTTNKSQGQPGSGPKKTKTSKSRNPDYDLMGVYIRKEVRRQIDRALAAREASEEKIQYSDLVESLIVEWLNKKGFSPESEKSNSG